LFKKRFRICFNFKQW